MIATLAADRVICGRYRILGVLGKGGMGVVFKAEDLALKRPVALKVTTVRTALGADDGDPHREERFLREASLSAQIAHPNVVTIYDYGHGEEDNEKFCYLAMELLTGETLGDRLRRSRGGLPTTDALRWMAQVARGLRAAHQHGLVHRDLKPDNIMLTPGEDGEEVARILDFGLAKDITSPYEAGITDAGTVMGTPEYMAPEQVESRAVDARTDLYAFGIVLYECITGDPPFRRDNAFRVAAAQVHDAPPPMVVAPPRQKPSNALRDLVSKLLQKSPAARIQTAEDLLLRLRELPEVRALRSQEAAEALSLSTAGRYQTGRKLSESSRALVYEATHLELGRQVVVKVFRAESPVEIARLKRELPALALLRHASNARVLDVGATSPKADGRPFLVMERVRGVTLRSLLTKHGALRWRRALQIAIAILDGLAEAHAVGVLHRQLSPEHVLVSGADTRREEIKIIGYRTADGDDDAGDVGLAIRPNPAYVAPELLRGVPMSEAADLYAAAVVLEECVTGRKPGSGVVAPTPGSLREIPAELAELIRRAVSVDPAERPESAGAFADALSAMRSLPDTAAPADIESPSVALSRTHRRLRSTGTPVVWVLMDDPALRKAPLTDALLRLRDVMRIEEIAPDHRLALAARLAEEEELPPWVVVFGGMHVILEDPLLAALGSTPEVSRLLVSTHANTELLLAAVDFCGLDQHITLPADEGSILQAIDRAVSRAAAARRYYDDLRLQAQRAPSNPGIGSKLGLAGLSAS
jgi:serine/threonine protein kinase